MPCLVDGHNLLWAIRQRDEQFVPVTAEDLCAILGRYGRLRRDRVEIVFDGTGPADRRAFVGDRGLSVRFSGPDSDADSVIESLLSTVTRPQRWQVVSSDRRVRRAARRAGIEAVDAVSFWIRVLETINRKPPAREPSAKHHGLGPAETRRWCRLFGLDDEETSP